MVAFGCQDLVKLNWHLEDFFLWALIVRFAAAAWSPQTLEAQNVYYRWFFVRRWSDLSLDSSYVCFSQTSKANKEHHSTCFAFFRRVEANLETIRLLPDFDSYSPELMSSYFHLEIAHLKQSLRAVEASKCRIFSLTADCWTIQAWYSSKAASETQDL